MIYSFECEFCETETAVSSAPFQPPPHPECCGQKMLRIYGRCQINTSACRDADFIPEEKRVVRDLVKQGPNEQREEARFQRHISERRKQLADGGNKGQFRHTHSVPADLYHGKIRETGDKDYWSDPKNLNRHKSTRVG